MLSLRVIGSEIYLCKIHLTFERNTSPRGSAAEYTFWLAVCRKVFLFSSGKGRRQATKQKHLLY
jgi:hypothetical protein